MTLHVEGIARAEREEDIIAVLGKGLWDSIRLL